MDVFNFHADRAFVTQSRNHSNRTEESLRTNHTNFTNPSRSYWAGRENTSQSTIHYRWSERDRAPRYTQS